MGISDKDKSLLQSAGALVAAVGVAWVTVELALKPFLSQARKALGKSDDATRDPDNNDDVTVVDKAQPPPPSTKPDDAAPPATETTTTTTSAPAVEA
uniref:Outer envelope membrane protein 7 n=1 Tax=Kalanchoe fedtschenkoi TaxID=63787 RepID=A0A7N0UWK9_KALFE